MSSKTQAETAGPTTATGTASITPEGGAEKKNEEIKIISNWKFGKII